MATIEPRKSPEAVAGQRRGLRVFLLIGTVILVAIAGVAALVFIFGLGAAGQTKVTISKATTYVTEFPRRPKGWTTSSRWIRFRSLTMLALAGGNANAAFEELDKQRDEAARRPRSFRC